MVGLLRVGSQRMIGFIMEFPLCMGGLLQVGLILGIGLAILKLLREL